MTSVNNMKINCTKYLIMIIIPLLAACDFIEPLPNGSYNEDNYKEYPNLIRGFVYKAYNKLPGSYNVTEFIGTDAGADNAMYRDKNTDMYQLSAGANLITRHPLSDIWTRDYEAIYYLNLYLKDNLGMNNRQILDKESDQLLRNYLQGDAYGLRAWYYHELLKYFGGVGTNGKLMGVPLLTEPLSLAEIPDKKVRESYDECVKQIMRDCDSAYHYLPLANRDFVRDYIEFTNTPVAVAGAYRYRALDKVSIDAIRALTCLTWASPAFNPGNDMTRYQKAALYAARVLQHKLEVESSASGIPNGFDQFAPFAWDNSNSQEIIWVSKVTANSTALEGAFYPYGFKGTANISPSQNLVDAFPMKNGYPITHPLSGYDPKNPYKDRDPRFYANILHNGAQIRRNTNNEVMYTIESAEGQKDAPKRTGNSPTSYYTKKFTYAGYNPYDSSPVMGNRSVFMIRWTQMALVFAEAANEFGGPETTMFGYTPKQVMKWIRSRPAVEGEIGVGAKEDPYLEECAAGGKEKFREFIRNERRIELCFEGSRFFDVRRWAKDVSEINVDVYGASIKEEDGQYVYNLKAAKERRSYPSLWLPIPYLEIRRCKGLIQNEGWKTWR